MLHHGLYEQVVNIALEESLEAVSEACKVLAPIDVAEASTVISQYMTEMIKQGLDYIVDNGGDITTQIDLANKIVNVIGQATAQDDFFENGIAPRAEQLLAILQEKDPLLAVGKSATALPRPETSVAQSSLFTGAIHEPQMVTELKKEIASADRIDMLVSFIKWSGLRLIIDELHDFVKRGGRLRVITTSYMGAPILKLLRHCVCS